MVADLRLLIIWTKKTSLDIPNLENQLNHKKHGKIFCLLDSISGFDFLPVQEEKYFTVSTPYGNYLMTGVPMGWCITAQYYQGTKDTFSYRFILCYFFRSYAVEDKLIYAENFEHPVENLEKLFLMLNEYSVRMSIKKCGFLKMKITFCCRKTEENKEVLEEN